MKSEGRPGSVRFVLVLAAMFLLQSLLGAVSQSMAGPLDQFGNPLCITSMDHAGSQSDHGGKHQAAECCTLGCSVLSGAIATPPDQAPILLGRMVVVERLDERYRRDALIAPDHDPKSPRAPPLSA